ncbi:translocation/assembly module TamB domain-containing protein [soil metagenome]
MADLPAPAEPTAPDGGQKPRRAHGWQRWLFVGILSLLLAVGGAMLWLDTTLGHRFLATRIAQIAPKSGLRIGVGRIDGSIYSKAVLHDVRLYDPSGLFFSAPQVALDWWPFAWMYNRLDIDRLEIPAATLHKLPTLRPTRQGGPILPDFDIRLMNLNVGRLAIDRRITGKPRVATISGDADIRSGRAIIDMSARVLDGSDALLLALDSRPDDDRFDLDVTVNAPKGGVLAAMAGLTQDANARIQGKGSWTHWKGSLLATLDRKSAMALRLDAKRGQYRLDGSVEGSAIAGNGLVQRLAAPRLALSATGTLEHRVIAGSLSATSAAIALNTTGAIDLRGHGFDNLLIDLKLQNPQALLKKMTGRNVAARVRLDGPFANPGYEYLLTAKQLAFGKTLLSDVRAAGKGRKAGTGPAIIPVSLSASRLDGAGDVVGSILRNFTLNGSLQVQGQRIVSNPMRVRADKLDGQLVVLADLKTGHYDIGLAGDIRGLLIPGLGIVDIRSKVQAVPAARGAFTLKGQAQATMRRLDNSFFRTLGGGLPVLRSNLALAPDARLMLSDLKLDAPLISLTGNGYRRPDGSVHIEGMGAHKTYGPAKLTLDGRIEKPTVDVLLAHPLNAAGLRDVAVHLDPDPLGFRFTANGGSTLGPFTGNGMILLPHAAQLVIDVQRLSVSGALARGKILPVVGGLDGRLEVTGTVTGFVGLEPVDGVQRLTTELNARDAIFDGPVHLAVARGKISAALMLDPAGTALDAAIDARGTQIGFVQIGRMTGNAKLVDGSGAVHMALSGQRGRLFDVKADADVTPDRVRLTAAGTLDRRPIRIVDAAIVNRTDDGWRLSPATISYMGGSLQLAGLAGGDATSVEARLQKLPLSLLDLGKSDLGLGGTATGTLSYAKPRNGVPTGQASMRVRGLTRSGLSLSSKPIDLGVNAALTSDRLSARAIVTSEGKTIGRAQALLHPLGQGDMVSRLRNAPLFAQLRYNGTADTPWRLTGVEIIDLSGPAAISADVKGTMNDPVIVGTVASDNATIDSPITGMRLTGVKARGRFGGALLDITSLTGTARGGGTVTGTGRFDFGTGTGVGIDLTIQATNAALLERDDIAATVTGPITIRSTGIGGTIGGDVDLIRSRFTLGRAAAVAQIPELRVVEIDRRGDEFERPLTTTPWHLDIRANARNRLMVTGLGLDSEWRAKLVIGGTVVNPTIQGQAQLVRGGYEFAGRRFDLTEGMIGFDGSSPVNPTLDIDAQANVNDINATIKVTGSGLAPEINFNSIPALPQDELLSRILFGTSITNLSAPEALQLASAVAALQGGGGGLDPINAVRKATGLDRLRILPADPTLGQGTSVAAGKYLTRKTYVELITDGQGYSATRIEYQVTRWLALLASISTIGRQSMNVRVSKDY